MRLLVLASLALFACGGSGPLTGTWVSQGSVIGSGWTLTLDQKYGSSISGTGVARVEAGASRNFTVVGTFQDNDLRATFHFEDGSNESYAGSLAPAGDALAGTVSSSSGSAAELDFTRQR